MSQRTNHIGVTVLTRHATHTEGGKREKERESKKERVREEREREGARGRVSARRLQKGGDIHGDQKRGKDSMSQRTITLASQW